MSEEKSSLHPRNLHRNSYDFDVLIREIPELKHFVFRNKYDNLSINFSLPKAVKLLNKALLKHYYRIENWNIPEANLCPPIPGRADYVHYIADLVAESFGDIPKGHLVVGVDVGVGANLVYPLLANRSYGWQMLGSDINEKSLKNAEQILEFNPDLKNFIKLKHQPNSDFIFKNIIEPNDKIVFAMCNPPFHDSQEAAVKGNIRKNKNLRHAKIKTAHFNFGGQDSELWCEGGEIEFVSKMIHESQEFSKQVLWFTCLVSKKDNLSQLLKLISEKKALEVKIIDMAQGQKISRILAWSFVPLAEHKNYQV